MDKKELIKEIEKKLRKEEGEMARESILVVDDERDARERICKLLKEEKYRPLGARNGLEAERRIKKNTIDLAIINLKTPKTDGIELIHRFRKSNSDVPIVIITGYPFLESAYDYIIKPFTIEEVKLVVNRALEKRRLIKANEMLIQQLEKAKRELEERVRQRTRKLEKAYQELKRAQERLVRTEKLTTVGRLGAGVAHEINNPLASVLLSAQRVGGMIKKQLTSIPDSREYLKNLERIERGVNRCKRIVAGLLAFSGPTKLQLTPTDINEVIEKTIESLEDQIKAQDVRVAKDFAAHLPLIVADEQQLSQVFSNLIVNACEAMPKGGQLRIITRLQAPEAGARSDALEEVDETVEIEISDTGKGILKKDLPRIFDPFFTTKEVGKGVGLGLSISYGIVKQHGGTIEVSSEKGKGTTVVVRFPTKTKVDVDTKLPTGITLRELNRTLKEKIEKEVITKTLNEANWNKAEVARRLEIDYKTLYYKIKNYSIRKPKV